MSDEWDLDSVDDIDLDDLDLMMDIEENPDVDDDRSAVDKIIAGSWDALKDEDNLSNIGGAFLKEALPPEYRSAVRAGDDTLTAIARLYDDTKKDIQGPLDDLKKMVSQQVNEGALSDSISDGLKEQLAPFLEVKKESDAAKDSRVDDLEEQNLTIALDSIFKRQSVEGAVQRETIDLGNKLTREGVKETALTNQLLSRMVGFNDDVIYASHRKSLEMSIRQYNVQKSLLGVMSAFAEDQDKYSQAIVKNTSLPEMAKFQGLEGLQSSIYGRVYGDVSGSIADFTRGFTDRVKENAAGLIGGIGNSLRETVTMVGDVTDALDMTNSAADGLDKTELFSGIFASESAEWLASKVGKKVSKMLRKVPAIERYAKDIEYFLSAYPQEARYFLSNWDGGVFPAEMIEKFPFLEKVNLSIMADKLKELTPDVDDQKIKIANSLSREAMTVVPFDNLTRRSIVEIIPGYLSRILNEISIQNGGDGDRVTYSVDKEDFVKLSDAREDLDRRLLSGMAGRRRQSVEDVASSVSDQKLPENLLGKLGDILLEEALAGNPFRAEEILGHDSLAEKERQTLSAWLRDSDKDKREIRKIFTRAMSQMTEGQIQLQEEVNRLYASGQSDLLRGIGLVTDSEVEERIYTSQSAKESIAKTLKDNRKKINRETTEEELVDMIENSSVREEALKLIKEADILNKLKSLKVKDEELPDITSEITKMEGVYNKGLNAATGVVNNKDINRRTVRQEAFMAEQEFVQRTLDPEITKAINVSVDNSDIVTAVIGQSDRFYDRFNIDVNDQKAIPVTIVDRMEGRAELDYTQTINEGFSELSQLMSMVVVNTAPLAEGIDTRSGLTRLLETTVKGSSKVLSSYVSGLYSATSSLFGAGGQIGSSAINASGRILSSIFSPRRFANADTQAQDIYVEGFKDPVITAEELRAGKYFDRDTGEPIFSLNDIKGTVVDASGDVVLSAKQLSYGIYNKESIDLSGLVSFAKKPFSFMGSYYRGMFNMARGIKNRSVNAVKNIRRGAFDVYVDGEDTPRIKAIVMKNGGYVSVASEKVILSPLDIDGPIMDQEGNIVLSLDDINQGITDVRGTPVGNFRTLGFIKDQASSALSSLKNMTTSTIGGIKDGASFLAKGAGQVIGSAKGLGQDMVDSAIEKRLGVKPSALSSSAVAGNPLDEQLKDQSITSTTILAKIYDHMTTVWPVEGEGLSTLLGPSAHADLADEERDDDRPADDVDGNGIRDNSLEEIRARRQAQNKVEEEAVKEQTEKGEGIWGRLFGILGAIGPGIISALGTLGTTIVTALGIKKGSDVASDVLGGVDGLGENDGKRRKGGKLGKFGRGVGKVAKGLGGAALTLGKGALRVGAAVGGFALRGLAATAAAAVSAPVAAAITAAGIGYAGYKAYSYISDRTETEPLERLRFMQYGIDVDNSDHRALIRQLESEIIDEVKYSGNSAIVKLTPRQAYEKYAEDWGVDMQSEAEGMRWAIWFAKRFVPVLVTHLTKLKEMGVKVDLTDIDDELEDSSQIFEYLGGVHPKKAGGDPLAVAEFGIPGKQIHYNRAEIRQYLHELRVKHSQDGLGKKAKVDDPILTKPIDEDKVSPYAAIDAKKRATRTVKDFSYVTQAPVTDPGRVRNRVVAAGSASTAAGITVANSKVPKSDPSNALMTRTKQAAKGKGYGFIRPVGEHLRISSPYGKRVHPIKGTVHYHKGIDFAGARGEPIYASADGKIIRHTYSKSYGLVIYIKHANDFVTRYAHMSGFAQGFTLGSEVKQGDVIGYVGSSGRSTGNHLHFEIRTGPNNSSKTMDPLKAFSDKSMLREVKEEEKALRDEDRNAPSLEDTIEGHDTMQSTAIPKKERSKIERQASGQEPALSLDVGGESTSGSSGGGKGKPEKAVPAEVKMDKDLKKTMDNVSGQNEVAQKTREDTNAKLDRLIELYEAGLQNGSDRATQGANAARNFSTPKKPKVNPVVDLSQ